MRNLKVENASTIGAFPGFGTGFFFELFSGRNKEPVTKKFNPSKQLQSNDKRPERI
jgi:hypothetical protein